MLIGSNALSFLLNFQPDAIAITTFSGLQLYKIGQRNYGRFISQALPASSQAEPNVDMKSWVEGQDLLFYSGISPIMRIVSTLTVHTRRSKSITFSL
jgi:hypothetical protein